MFVNLSHLARDFQALLMVSQHSAWVLRRLILLKAVKKSRASFYQDDVNPLL